MGSSFGAGGDGGEGDAMFNLRPRPPAPRVAGVDAPKPHLMLGIVFR